MPRVRHECATLRNAPAHRIDWLSGPTFNGGKEVVVPMSNEYQGAETATACSLVTQRSLPSLETLTANLEDQRRAAVGHDLKGSS